MKFAIIAAGEGSRLAEEGIQQPKPLVELGGQAMIDRLMGIFLDCGATEIYVICNQLTSLVSDHLESCRKRGLPVRYVVKTTASSMHSLYELAPMLEGDEPFVVTTVDTIFRTDEFNDYVNRWQRLADSGEADGLMGVTDYIDDEKPLYVQTDPQLRITAFLDTEECPHYISGGIYGLTPRALNTLRTCINRGESRMRNFQRALVADGLRLRAYPFSKVLDIDHASDIRKAEEFLMQNSHYTSHHGHRSVLAILRAECFSPNSVERDRSIMMALVRRLQGRGCTVQVISEEELPHDINTSVLDLVLSMGRLPETLAWLKTLRIPVINDPLGVERCARSVLHDIMLQEQIPVPPTQGDCGYWLKRGDAAAQIPEDVLFTADEQELQSAIEGFRQRDISDYVVSAHIPGDLVKFYGVLGTGFFRLFYPTDDGQSKFGHEAHNGPAHHYAFSTDNLQQTAERLAFRVGVAVYGGDAIVRPDGTFCLIDFNDWPSFSRCREDAAASILQVIEKALSN